MEAKKTELFSLQEIHNKENLTSLIQDFISRSIIENNNYIVTYLKDFNNKIISHGRDEKFRTYFKYNLNDSIASYIKDLHEYETFLADDADLIKIVREAKKNVIVEYIEINLRWRLAELKNNNEIVKLIIDECFEIFHNKNFQNMYDIKECIHNHAIKCCEAAVYDLEDISEDKNNTHYVIYSIIKDKFINKNILNKIDDHDVEKEVEKLNDMNHVLVTQKDRYHNFANKNPAKQDTKFCTRVFAEFTEKNLKDLKQLIEEVPLGEKQNFHDLYKTIHKNNLRDINNLELSFEDLDSLIELTVDSSELYVKLISYLIKKLNNQIEIADNKINESKKLLPDEINNPVYPFEFFNQQEWVEFKLSLADSVTKSKKFTKLYDLTKNSNKLDDAKKIKFFKDDYEILKKFLNNDELIYINNNLLNFKSNLWIPSHLLDVVKNTYNLYAKLKKCNLDACKSLRDSINSQSTRASEHDPIEPSEESYEESYNNEDINFHSYSSIPLFESPPRKEYSESLVSRSDLETLDLPDSICDHDNDSVCEIGSPQIISNTSRLRSSSSPNIQTTDLDVEESNNTKIHSAFNIIINKPGNDSVCEIGSPQKQSRLQSRSASLLPDSETSIVVDETEDFTEANSSTTDLDVEESDNTEIHSTFTIKPDTNIIINEPGNDSVCEIGSPQKQSSTSRLQSRSASLLPDPETSIVVDETEDFTEANSSTSRLRSRSLPNIQTKDFWATSSVQSNNKIVVEETDVITCVLQYIASEHKKIQKDNSSRSTLPTELRGNNNNSVILANISKENDVYQEITSKIFNNEDPKKLSLHFDKNQDCNANKEKFVKEFSERNTKNCVVFKENHSTSLTNINNKSNLYYISISGQYHIIKKNDLSENELNNIKDFESLLKNFFNNFNQQKIQLNENDQNKDSILKLIRQPVIHTSQICSYV